MKSIRLYLLLSVLGAWLVSCSGRAGRVAVTGEDQYSSPPSATARPDTFREFGQLRIDNFFWLKNKDNPEVIAYLEAENRYCDTVMAHTRPLQEALFEEMKGRIKEEDNTVPVSDNGFWYYTRTLRGKQYPVHCRKQGDTLAAEEVLFDVNQMAEGQKAFIFAGYSVSPDNRLAAYASNNTGSSALFELRVRDLATGSDLGTPVSGVRGFAWAGDSKTLFYTVVTPSLRPYRVCRMTPGESTPGITVFEEPDPRFNVGIHRSKTGEWLFITSASSYTTEYRMIPASEPQKEPRIFLPRTEGVDYTVQHHEGGFYIRYKTSELFNGKIFKAPLNGFGDTSNWETVVEHDPELLIQGFTAYRRFLGLYIRKNGLNEIRILYPETRETHTISFPEPVYTVYPSNLPEYESPVLRYVYSSLNRPQSTFEFDVEAKTSALLKVQEIPGGFNPLDYAVERVWAEASDGVKVPMAILYKKGLRRDGNNPALLEGYGSYGASTDASFRANVFSLVDRGYVYGIAQVRGGSELGEQWYEAGKLMHKKNSFSDFVACAENLVQQKFTSPSLLGIRGGSAGGLLMGAVVNLSPGLFNVVLANVPFVDVVNTMLDDTLPLTTQEYEEWGNPNEEEVYHYIRSYSPYDNLQPGPYPHILATAGINDSQVSYHEPAKWVARIRTLKSNNSIVLLRTNMESGHGGATGRFDYLKELAFQYAFLIDRNGK